MQVCVEVARRAACMNKMVILDPAPARPMPSELYRYCTYITPNETEAQALVGFPVTDAESAHRAAKVLLARGAGCAGIKMGEMGAYYMNAQDAQHVPAFPVPVVDTVAAGDAFNGTLAVALAEGLDLEPAIRWAAAAGALAVTKTGAQDSMPYRHEVERLLTSKQGG